MYGLRQRGFSAAELMTTVAIVAVLLTVAMPGFRDALVRSRVSGTAIELQSALSLARAEALKLKLPVTVCARASGTACATGTSWSDGFLMFQDPNGNGVVDAGDVILRSRPLTLPNVVIESTGPSVSILGNGRIAGGAQRALNVRGTGCAVGTGPDIGQRFELTVAASGRASSRRLGCA